MLLFQGDKYKVRDIRNPKRWEEFFLLEKQRGINYVNLAGAEPALVPEILEVCYKVIPLGTIFTNGLKKISSSIDYRIHISIWGDQNGDSKFRRMANGDPGPHCLVTQLENFKNDPRVIFVYTFNGENISQIDEVLKVISGEGHKITFNVFSDPIGGSSLKFGASLQKVWEKMVQAMQLYPNTVIYSYYNALVHTQPLGLRAQFGCPYPRAEEKDGSSFGIGRTFRSYRTDFTSFKESDCCVPDTDCTNCRHYAAGSAIVSSRMDMHVKSEAYFRGWLDYVDTYLAIWVRGYEKGSNLFLNNSLPS